MLLLEKTKVLVFPCGSQPAIDINFSLRNLLRIEVYGASSIEDHGSFIYKKYFGGIPNISEDNFIEVFNNIISDNNIDFVIPTHDTVSLFLIENQQFINARIVTSDLNTNRICRSKKLTYNTFLGCTFTPKVYGDISEVNTFPVFLKPDQGQGGQGTKLLSNLEELKYYAEKNRDYLITEYLPGEELTIDCFTDKKGNIRFLSARTRERIFGGISVKSKLTPVTEEIRSITHKINQELNFRGYWYFQLKRDSEGIFKLLEISTRMAGTSVLTVSNGINIPLLSILEFQDLDYEINANNLLIELERALINRYKISLNYKRVYVDLDDTIIFGNGQINNYLMMFLYQCVNKKQEIVLITKHTKKVNETLAEYNICPTIFARIIHINPNEYKCHYIDNEVESIFIDNSFIERKQVKDNLNIPTFDLNNVECLIDWRG